MTIVAMILGMNCASFSPKHIPTAYETDSMKGAISDSMPLTRSIPLDKTSSSLLKRLAKEGNAEDLQYQCVLLELLNVREAEGQQIGVRIFLNLPEANPTTRFEVPNFVTSFSFAGSNPKIPRDLIFNLKPTVLRLGEELLETLDQGALTLTLVPFRFRTKEGAEQSQFDLRAEKLNLVLDCE